ncbi:MAG: hypothetical protein RPU39_17995 [Candidatus Sedimenticola sp. (ex Thyasira tokunagai)]
MKKYTADDIKRLDWGAHVRNRPQVYFPSAEVDAKEIAKAIEDSAKILGVKKQTLKKSMNGLIFVQMRIGCLNQSLNLNLYKKYLAGQALFQRCQPWRAKRRLVIPGSREAALLTRRAHSAPEGKQSRHPNTASSHWELTAKR